MRRLFTFAAALAAGLLLTSCFRSSISPDGYANQGDKVAPESAALSSHEQKEKLEQTGEALLDELDEEKWEDTAEFFRALAEHFAELDDDAMDAFEEWSDEIEEAIEERKFKRGKMTLRSTAALSKVTKGTFKEIDEVFEFTPGGNAVKIITYVNGNTVTITMTHGGESKAYEVESEHWEAKSDWEKRYYGDEEYTESDEVYSVKIPSWINVEVKEGPILRANWKVNIKFTDADNDGKVSLEEDSAEIDTEVKAAGYTVSGTEKYYNKDGVAYTTTSSTLSRGAKTLVTAAMEGSGEIEGDLTGDRIKIKSPKTVKGAVDILGQVQAKGSVDYEEALALEERLDPYGDKKDYSRTISKMEKCMDIAIYYDKKGGKQAWFGLEPFYNEKQGRWSYDPVIRFADDSSYALGDFFNADNFDSLLEDFEDWLDDLQYYYGAIK